MQNFLVAESGFSKKQKLTLLCLAIFCISNKEVMTFALFCTQDYRLDMSLPPPCMDRKKKKKKRPYRKFES